MSTQEQQPGPKLADDLLHGAAAIADYVGLTERQVRHQIDQGNLPVTRMGRLIMSTKSALRAFFTPKQS